jgi:hypothetical protein
MTIDVYAQYSTPTYFVIDIELAIRTFYEETADVYGTEELLKDVLHESLIYIQDLFRVEDGLEAMAEDVLLYFTQPHQEDADIIVNAAIKLARAVYNQFRFLGFYAPDGKLYYDLVWLDKWIDYYTPVLTRKPFNELEHPTQPAYPGFG